MSEIPKERTYVSIARELAGLLDHGLTPAEAVDYIVVEKADNETDQWAAFRDIPSQSISDNIANAHEKINAARLDAEVTENDETVVVRVTAQDGTTTHELPFVKSLSDMNVVETEPQLQLIYEDRTAILGYYSDNDGNEFESTLWFDGQLSGGLEEFDVYDQWGSPEAKADTILWSATDS